MSNGVHSRVNRKGEGRVCCGNFLSTQVTAVADLVTKCLLFFPSALILAFGRKDVLVETRYGYGLLRHPDHGPDAPDSFLLGEVLVQRPAIVGEPHLDGDVVLYGRVDKSLHDHFGCEHDDDADLLRVDLLERSGEIGQQVQILGVGHANAGAPDPLHEEVPPVDAEVVVAVEERGPVPLEVQEDADDHVDDLFVGMHRSQERGEILLT